MSSNLNRILTVLVIAIAAYKATPQFNLAKVKQIGIGIRDEILEYWLGSKGLVPKKSQVQQSVTSSRLQRDALHKAAKSGFPEALNVLLNNKHFTDVNTINSEGMTALHQAVFSGHLEVAKLLLKHSRFTNAGAQDGFLQNELHIAAYIGSAEMMSHLLGHPRFPSESVNHRDKDGDTALTQALLMNHTEVAQVLLEDQRFEALWVGGASNAFELAQDRNHTDIINKIKAHRLFHQSLEERKAYEIKNPKKNVSHHIAALQKQLAQSQKSL